MQLHHFTNRKKSAKRVGRGGKRGTTSGRGTKGQHSRAGRRIRPAARDLLIRIPKLRGFRNKPKSAKPIVIDLSALSRKLKLQAGHGVVNVDMSVLKELGMVSVGYRGKVKILSDGEIAFPITVRGIEVSQKAQEKIVQAGGKVQ